MNKLWRRVILVGFVTAAACCVFMVSELIRHEMSELQEDLRNQVDVIEHYANASFKVQSSALIEDAVAEIERHRRVLIEKANTGELLLGQESKGYLVYLTQRRFKQAQPGPLAIAQHQWLPMARAARGESGVAITKDYRNQLVMAAFTFSKKLGCGVVLKYDVLERLGLPLAALGLTLLLALLGGIWLVITYRSEVGPRLRMIAERDALLDGVIGSMPVAVMVQDRNGCLIMENDLAIQLRLAGISSLSHCGEVGSELTERPDWAFRKVKEEIVSHRFSDRAKVRGVLRDFQVIKLPVLDRSNQVDKAVTFVIDVSAEHQAAKALAALSSKEIETLRSVTASLSHELSNPLTAVLADLEMLLEAESELSIGEQTELANEALCAAQRMRDVLMKLSSAKELAHRDYLGRLQIYDLNQMALDTPPSNQGLNLLQEESHAIVA